MQHQDMDMDDCFDDDYNDEDEYLYGDDEDDCCEDEANYGIDGLEDDIDGVKSSTDCKPYTILSSSEIRKRQEELISIVSSTLCISTPKAIKLLYHYNWEASLVQDTWYADEERARAKTGLISNTNSTFLDKNNVSETMCMICFELFPYDDFNFCASDCGHIFCVTCWNGYISTSINDGPGCLSLRCPEPNCKTSICQDMVDKLVGSVEREKYNQFLIRSFTDGSKKVKWCPAPGCENAVEFEVGSDVFDVTCLCTNSFCWNCVEEIHRPADCMTVSKWILKNSSESENTAWILANSKPCPKCNRAIEKNSGCMHMTCTPPCKFEFCWLCLGDWTKHGEKTGGFYACNIYEVNEKKGVYAKDSTSRQLAKRYLERYTHFYERWDANDKSRQKAIEVLEETRNKTVGWLSISLDIPETEFGFILKAWEQIIECRLVLKWTYAYGYYLGDDQPPKKTLFEFLQGQAEAALERLHQCAEKEVSELCEADQLKEAEKIKERTILYDKFKEKLNRLTKVTRLHFDKLVAALEKGLPEVKTIDVVDHGSSSIVKDEEEEEEEEEEEDCLNESHYWTCSVCTFANHNSSDECEMCAEGEFPYLEFPDDEAT